MSDFADTIKAVSVCIQARVPALLTGIPGDAKTSIVESLFEQLAEDHETSIVALHEPPEYGGFPVPQEDGVALLPATWVARLAQITDERKLAGLFLDELSNGAPATRSAAMRGIMDGTWGELNVPRLATVAAMNPVELSESGYELSAPLANRFCHLDWSMPVGYWLDALVAGFPEPEVARVRPDFEKQHGPTATTLVAAFGKHLPGSIKNLPKEQTLRAGPWPSLRSWTNARTLTAACMSAGFGLEDDVTVMLLGGCVGPAAAGEFVTYSKELDLPDPEEVLRNPKKLKLPQRGDRAYAVLTAVTTAVLSNNTAERWTAAWDVLAVAVEMGRPDVAAGAARALAKNKPKEGIYKAPKAVGAFVPLLKAAGMVS